MPYSIEFQPDPPLMRVTVSGFWDKATLTAFAHDMKPIREAVLARHGHFDSLTDASGFTVQSADVVAGFQAMHEASDTRGRSAIVAGSALARLQAKRSVADATTAVFGRIEDAEAWLAQAPAERRLEAQLG